jgi:acyl-CoA hydrolase
MTEALAPRPQSRSRTEMNEHVLPPHANALNNVFGGQVMAWVDLCAAITAQRHSGHVSVTAFVDDLVFQNPVKIGDVVNLEAHVTATFRTSLEVSVIVLGENPRTLERWPCVTALLTFVAIDANGKPTPVPPLVLDTDAVRASQAAGEARRAARLTKKPTNA